MIGQYLRAGGIVRHVKDPGHRPGTMVEPAGQACRPQSLYHRGTIRAQSGRQLHQSGQRAGGIAVLMRAVQRRWRQIGPIACSAVKIPLPVASFTQAKIAARTPARRPQPMLQKPVRGRRVGADQGPGRTADARFLTCDAVPVGAQPIGVIQIDGGDERNVGIHHIDGIEPSP